MARVIRTGDPDDDAVRAGAAAAAAAGLVDDVIATGRVPGAVLVTGVGPDGPTHIHLAGHLDDGTPIDGRTLFDLASLTKVLATVPVVLRLDEMGVLALDDPVVRFLPEVAVGGAAKAQVTLRHLLTHTAGLPAGRRFHLECEGSEAIRERIRAEPLIAPPGTAMCYSDVGFMLLGDVVEAATGESIDAIADRLVFAPLGMADTRFRPPPEWRARCAPTEVLADGVAKRGVVHDENAEALGGVAGHAGLFATGADVARFVRAWLAPDARLLTGPSRAAAMTCQTGHLRARRGLGWVLRGDMWDHMGTAWPGSGAGHTGFTGTSVGIDPVSGIWAVLLTNAVRVARQNPAVMTLRRAVHDAVATAHAAVRVPAPRRAGTFVDGGLPSVG